MKYLPEQSDWPSAFELIEKYNFVGKSNGSTIFFLTTKSLLVKRGNFVEKSENFFLDILMMSQPCKNITRNKHSEKKMFTD